MKKKHEYTMTTDELCRIVGQLIANENEIESERCSVEFSMYKDSDGEIVGFEFVLTELDDNPKPNLN